jgi:hypothetical protein
MVLPPVSASAGMSALRAASLVPGVQSLAGTVQSFAQPSTLVNLSGLGSMFSALSELRTATASLQETTAANLTRQRVASFVEAMNRFTQSLAISAADESSSVDTLQLPDAGLISSTLLQNGGTASATDLSTIGIRFGADGNINIDTAQFSSALTQNPLRTIGLLSNATHQLDAMTTLGAAGFQASALSTLTPPLAAANQSASDILSLANAGGLAGRQLPLQTVQALRSFLDIAAL